MDKGKPPQSPGVEMKKVAMMKPMVKPEPAAAQPPQSPGVEIKKVAMMKPMVKPEPATAQPIKQEVVPKMLCPKCGIKLETVAFREVQIDRCPTCRGVWLDPGELNKIAESGRISLFEAVANQMIPKP